MENKLLPSNLQMWLSFSFRQVNRLWIVTRRPGEFGFNLILHKNFSHLPPWPPGPSGPPFHEQSFWNHYWPSIILFCTKHLPLFSNPYTYETVAWTSYYYECFFIVVFHFYYIPRPLSTALKVGSNIQGVSQRICLNLSWNPIVSEALLDLYTRPKSLSQIRTLLFHQLASYF